MVDSILFLIYRRRIIVTSLRRVKGNSVLGFIFFHAPLGVSRQFFVLWSSWSSRIHTAFVQGNRQSRKKLAGVRDGLPNRKKICLPPGLEVLLSGDFSEIPAVIAGRQYFSRCERRCMFRCSRIDCQHQRRNVRASTYLRNPTGERSSCRPL